MYNMTIRDSDRWYVIGSDGQRIPWEQIPRELYGALCKLHDYEKLGLSPDDVYRLVLLQESKSISNCVK